MTVPFLDLLRNRDEYEPEFRKHLDEILESGIFILGPKTVEIESKIALLLNAKHAVACSSGTDGLLLALLAYGIGPGDEVITTPYSFFATVSAIVRAGARPVFTDIDPRTFNINPAFIEEKITGRTRAILPVHLYGNPSDMEAISGLARKHNLIVIEDAAQAIGAGIHGEPVGAIGDAGVLSFYPTKNLPAMGDAGMVITNDDEKAGILNKLRIHGSGAGAYIHEIIGLNARIDAFQAASLLAKLPLLDDWNESRRNHAAEYDKAFKDTPLVTPYTEPNVQHVYHLYTIRTGDRDRLKSFLNARGIGCGVYYPLPLHLQPCFASLGCSKGDFPESERAAMEVLSLPCYPYLTAGEREEVVSAVLDFFATGGGNE
ncbi:MAG: DegT/DnrJ/EryC1/StrS family aminotransferase [Planctomycetota bacterium]|jgi:dTDP-4-amino-4,6-dideoxygalactose transaminase